MKKKRDLVFKAGAITAGIAVGVAAMLFAVEMLLTAKYSEIEAPELERVPGYDSGYVARYRAGLDTADMYHDRPLRIHVNNFNMRRDTDVSQLPPAGVTRVLSYGDSIASGFHVDLFNHYTYKLEKRLAADGRRFEILNMARGHSPGIHAMHLRVDLPRLRPHWVMQQIELANDVSDEAFVSHEGYDQFGMPQKITGGRYILSWDDKWLSTMPVGLEFLESKKFYLFFLQRVGWFLSMHYPNPVFSLEGDTFYYSMGYDRHYLTRGRLERAFERMFVTIKAMQRYVEANGARYVLLVSPTREMFFENRFRAGNTALYEKALARAAQLGIPYVPAKSAFEGAGGSELFFDFCHPNFMGYEVLTNELYRHFK
ncbi:MAG: hypothetical protein A2583_03905 [Bdellovibrionales bacterium RIFOXYD1_FULL_53_11]|nr:MAG: hypothetical protein A2583_03905 [Bdellovibrionales bacterium RIFOXYD1_FULL_53_11]